MVPKTGQEGKEIHRSGDRGPLVIWVNYLYCYPYELCMEFTTTLFALKLNSTSEPKVQFRLSVWYLR